MFHSCLFLNDPSASPPTSTNPPPKLKPNSFPSPTISTNIPRTSTLNETTSDLTNLRIALKAIELQCPPPQNLDEDLRQSIQNWKADWKRIKEARASRRHHRREASSLLSSPGTPW